MINRKNKISTPRNDAMKVCHCTKSNNDLQLNYVQENTGMEVWANKLVVDIVQKIQFFFILYNKMNT